MIKKIDIKGFKSFDSVSLELNNFTLLAGRNSMGKTSVIQAVFAMLQDGNNPFRGEYMNIGSVNELLNAIVRSSEIEFNMEYEYDGKIDRLSKKITKQGTDSEGKTEKKIKLIYCSSDRIGVKDTYEKYLGDEIVIGKNCDYVFHYLNAYDEMELDKDRDFVYDSKSKLTFGGQVNFWLNKIMGYQVKAREIEKTEFIQVLYRNEKVLFEMRPKNVGTGVTYITELIIAALERV